MRCITSLFFALALATLALGQAAPPIEWQRCLGGSGAEDARDIAITSDNGFVVIGSTNSVDGDVSGFHGGSSDYWVVKLNEQGLIEWQRTLGGSNSDSGCGIAATEDGGCIVIGNSRSTDGDVSGNHGWSDVWVVKLSVSGTVEWQRSYGGSETDTGYGILELTDGGYIFAGETNSVDGDVSANLGSTDVWVVRIDQVGEILWERSYGGNSFDVAFALDHGLGDTIIVAGYTTSATDDVSTPLGIEDQWVIAISSTDGNLYWERSIGGTGYDVAGGVTGCSDGGAMVVGWSTSTTGDAQGNHGQFDILAARLGAQGQVQWSRVYGGTGSEKCSAVLQQADGGFLFGARTNSEDGDVVGEPQLDDVWLFRTDEAGAIIWQTILGGSNHETTAAIHHTPDGGYILLGTSISNDGDVSGNNGSNDFWVVKFRPELNSIAEFEDSRTITLSPNPTRDRVALSATGIPNGMVEIILFDAIGQIVHQQQGHWQEGSPMELELNGSAPGLYTTVLLSKEAAWSARLVIME